jgi:hypothetical protein
MKLISSNLHTPLQQTLRQLPRLNTIFFSFYIFDLVDVRIKCDVDGRRLDRYVVDTYYLFSFFVILLIFCVHLPSLFFLFLLFFPSNICHFMRNQGKTTNVAFIDLVSRPFFPAVSFFKYIFVRLFSRSLLFCLLIVFPLLSLSRPPESKNFYCFGFFILLFFFSLPIKILSNFDPYHATGTLYKCYLLKSPFLFS